MPDYQHPYPSPELAAEHPFRPLGFERLPASEMVKRARDLHESMDRRRSVRMFSDEPVGRELIELAIQTASTAPSGAHKQPWHFVAVSDPAVKAKIREAAEEEERINYLDNRMNEEWQEALAPLGTDHHKEFLEFAPWIVVVFEERFQRTPSGDRKNYYVKESVGLATGLFIAAIHNMGLVTLPHTPSPMAFLREVLERPDNERPFVMLPIGFPLADTQVPDISRKALSQVSTFI